MVVTESPNKKEVMVCYDAQLSKAQVVEHLRTLFEAAKLQGLRIAKVDFGVVLKYDGQWIRNDSRSKALLTLEKATVDNQEPSLEVIEAFKKFFEWKIVPDEIVKEMEKTSDA